METREEAVDGGSVKERSWVNVRFGLVVVPFDETGKDSKRRKYGVEESGVLCFVHVTLGTWYASKWRC